MKYYIMYNGTQVGPMEPQQLLAYGLNPRSKVWAEGLPQWVDAYTIPELMAIMPAVPAYIAPTKSKLAAGLFAILLGGLGIQYFYVGKIAGGLICILLTFVTCGIWSIVSLIQGILMITMSDSEFESKYVTSPSTFPLF